MNKTTVNRWKLALALCLVASGANVLAQGRGTDALQNQVTSQYHCSLDDPSVTTTAKSPQRTGLYSCVLAKPRIDSRQAGDTAAKTPSRVIL